jgi:hypothetical protein
MCHRENSQTNNQTIIQRATIMREDQTKDPSQLKKKKHTGFLSSHT